MKNVRSWRNLWWAFAFLTMNACGGGGGSSSSASSEEGGLSIAEQVSVVDASDEASSSLSKSLAKAVSALPSGSDYYTDPSFMFVEERSADAFDIVNEILCFLDQSAYDNDSLLNTGAYIAQINANECSSSQDDAESAAEASGNETSGSDAPEYEYWTVLSERAGAGEPQYVSLWADEGDELIKAYLTITEAASDTNPYGLFHMNFVGEDPESGEQQMFGYLRAIEENDEVVLQFFANGTEHGGPMGEEFTFQEQATLNRSSDGSSGSGEIFMSNGFEGEKGFQIAYDDGHFLRSDGSAEVCLSRTEFETSAWRYNLYQTEAGSDPGSRFDMNGGFSIVFMGSDGEEHHGYVGYWGLWTEGEELENGTTVTKQDFSADEVIETDYNLFLVKGKLIKRTREITTLGEIQGIPLSWWNDGSDVEVQWNWSQQAFYITGTRSPGEWLVQELDEPQLVEFSENDYSFNFWSQSLGGDGFVEIFDENHEFAELTNDTEVVFFRNSTVLPGEVVPESLYCFNQCPNPSNIDDDDGQTYGEGGSITDTDGDGEFAYYKKSMWGVDVDGDGLIEWGQDVDGDGEPDNGDDEATFNRLAQDVAPSALVENTHYVSYTFDTDNMVLKRGGVAVLATDSSLATWGVRSDILFEPTTANLAALQCDWNANNTCPWNAQQRLEVSYTWETGKEDWNQLALLQDPTTEEFLSFDQPVTVQYQDSDTGKSYFLEYAGNGDLWGLPEKCVDMDSGEDVSCSEASEDNRHIRWVPLLTIPDGSTVTDLGSNTEYYVKALEKEQRMVAVESSECAGLDLVDYTLPDEDVWDDPGIGDQPEVTDPPAVIDGELQLE